MEILVCARRVPDTSENEIELNSAGNDIERDDLVYSVNEPDNYAVEEALQIAGRTGGKVTVATVGGDEDEEILRREMAMGAHQGVLISDEAFNGSDGKGIAVEPPVERYDDRPGNGVRSLSDPRVAPRNDRPRPPVWDSHLPLAASEKPAGSGVLGSGTERGVRPGSAGMAREMSI